MNSFNNFQDIEKIGEGNSINYEYVEHSWIIFYFIF